jgi:hypothetical protein
LREAARSRELVLLAEPESSETSAQRGSNAVRARSAQKNGRGRRWFDEIVSGSVTDVQQIAARQKCSVRPVNMTISLAFLATGLVRAAVEGRLPRGIGVERLRDAPAEWRWQFEASDLIAMTQTQLETALLVPKNPAFLDCRRCGRDNSCRWERNFCRRDRRLKIGLKNRKRHRRPEEAKNTGKNPRRIGLFAINNVSTV